MAPGRVELEGRFSCGGEWVLGLPHARAALKCGFSLLCRRQCALAALRDVKSYLTKEGGQIAVSLGNTAGWVSCPPAGWCPHWPEWY